MVTKKKCFFLKYQKLDKGFILEMEKLLIF